MERIHIPDKGVTVSVTQFRPYPGMLPDEDDLEPFGDELDAESQAEIKPCLSCMAPNDDAAVRCVSCGATFGEPSMVFPAGRLRRSLPNGSVRPSKIEVLVTCILNLAFIAWNVAAIRNMIRDPLSAAGVAILAVGVLFLVISLRNLYRIFSAYRHLPSYWDIRQ